MAGIQVAESSSKPSKAPKKVLSHLELHPRLGGGHIVRHVYQGYQHDSKDVQFNEEGKSQGGEHIAAHLKKHAGLPGMDHDADDPQAPAEAEE